MKVIVVGLGVQGRKRKQFSGNDFIASVDPMNLEADYKDITAVPLASYAAALVCLPDLPKFQVIQYLLEHGKHVLVEKPLWCETRAQLLQLQQLALSKKLVCYTAYNHRFEPHYMRMKQLIDSGELGEIYHCRLFYGNGTARLVRNSVWRDEGMGVLTDLAPHLMDVIAFWFGYKPADFELISADCFENEAPDHVVIRSKGSMPKLMFEMSLLSWRNHFTCDIRAEKGSAHIESLCKWGPSQFVHRTRVLPSGRPPEEAVTLVQDDPTWALEYVYFKELVAKNTVHDLSNDLWIYDQLHALEEQYAVEKGVTA